MEIRRLNKHDFNNLLAFNKKSYPEKDVDMSGYLKFWLSKSELEYERTLVVVNDDGQIVGQNFFSTMSYYFEGLRHESVWGFDLIVDENYRKTNWGVDLLLACKKSEPHSFATGSNPDALKMNIKLGQKWLGEIRKYVGVVNPLWFLSALTKKSYQSFLFPSKVFGKSYLFEKVSHNQFPDFNQPYSNLLEFVRDKKFLDWRYNNSLHEYSFYSSAGKESYFWFVVRTTIIKHIPVLILVDWRCNLDNLIEFEQIVDACKRIANRLRIPVIITGSSLSRFDLILESKMFISIGRPRPIIGRIKINDYQKDIEQRKFVFVTLADSDGETNWR